MRCEQMKWMNETHEQRHNEECNEANELDKTVWADSIDTDRIHRSSIKQQWIDSKTANEGLTNAMQVFNTNIQT